MLSEQLLPSPAPAASDLTEAAVRRLALQQDEEDVRAPLPAVDDILLPSAPVLSPATSSTSSLSSADEEPPPTSFLRYLFTRGLFLYLLAFTLLSFTLLLLLPHPSPSCSALLTPYLAGNGCLSLSFALLLLYVARHAPPDISHLATAADTRSEGIRWVAITCVKQVIGAVDFAFFILGHVAFFSSSSSTCAASSPVLYAFTLASLVSGYLGFFIPLCVFLYLTYSYRALIFRARPPAGQYNPRPASAAELKLVLDSTWGEDKEGDEEESVCAICYTEYEAGNVLSTLPCDPHHFFHKHCIHQWLTMRDSCPLCKARLKVALEKPQGGARRRRRRRRQRQAVAGGLAGVSALVPVMLPGMAAASLAVTSVMGEREEKKAVAVEACVAPSPLGVGSPLRGVVDGECEQVVVSVRGEEEGDEVEEDEEEEVEEEVGEQVRVDVGGEARRAAVRAALARMEAQRRLAAQP